MSSDAVTGCIWNCGRHALGVMPKIVSKVCNFFCLTIFFILCPVFTLYRRLYLYEKFTSGQHLKRDYHAFSLHFHSECCTRKVKI